MSLYSYGAQTVADAVCGELLRCGTKAIERVSTHSDAVLGNALFVALSGTHHDGHDYLLQALQNGACALLFSKKHFDVSLLPDGDYSAIAVDDPLLALGAFAAFHRRNLTAKVIAVTGSVGKTATKQFLHALFSQAGETVATQGNFNNELGVPLTLLSIPQSASYAIVEMGMSHAGEIRYLSSLARPDAAIITNVGTSHIGNLGSRYAIAQAKKEIFDFLKPEGLRILCKDEPLLSDVSNAITVSWEHADADYLLKEPQETDGGTVCTVLQKDASTTSLFLPIKGRHLVFDAALAYACAHRMGLTQAKIQAGFAAFVPSKLRQELYDFPSLRVIADCYNAAPESMEAALDFLSDLSQKEGRRAVAVLGDMRELGDHSLALHRNVGRSVATHKIPLLITYGKDAMEIGASAKAIFPKLHWHCITNETIDTLWEILRSHLQKGDLLLLKGSRAMQLELLLPRCKEWSFSFE